VTSLARFGPRNRGQLYIRFPFQKLAVTKQLPDLIPILDHNVQVRTGDTDVRMASGIANLGHGSAASQGVALLFRLHARDARLGVCRWGTSRLLLQVGKVPRAM
jgi:hypothetical protein